MNPNRCTLPLPPPQNSPPQLAAEQDGVRFGTSQCLRNLARHCVSRDMVAAAAAAVKARAGGAGGNQGARAPLESVLTAAAGALGARYQEAWPSALPGEEGLWLAAARLAIVWCWCGVRGGGVGGSDYDW